MIVTAVDCPMQNTIMNLYEPVPWGSNLERAASRSYGIWCCVTGLVLPDVSKD